MYHGLKKAMLLNGRLSINLAPKRIGVMQITTLCSTITLYYIILVLILPMILELEQYVLLVMRAYGEKEVLEPIAML